MVLWYAGVEKNLTTIKWKIILFMEQLVHGAARAKGDAYRE